MTIIHKCNNCGKEKEKYPFGISLKYLKWYCIDDCRPSSDSGHHQTSEIEAEFCSYKCLQEFVDARDEDDIKSYR